MEKIRLRHIDPAKKTVTIDKGRYQTLQNAVCISLEGKEMPFKSLLAATRAYLLKNNIKFEGSVSWYLAWVCIHMEAIGEIKVDRSKSPHKIGLVCKN